MVSRETIGRVAVALVMGACGPVRGALDGNFRAPAEEVREVVPGFLWIEAEGFADYGNWKLDTQFTHKMGSAYLLAAGALKPIGAAKTSVRVPRAGRWTAWVRTKDWVPEHHPGRFRLSLNGKPGRELGASGRAGWAWERAGAWQLEAGRAAVALEDLTGAFARCDAVLLTTDAGYVPPEDAEALASERQRLTGADPTVRDGGDFDVVVVGAGTGGMGAALAAARQDARVALVHDRPVLGGNASMELGVPIDGAAVHHPYAREGGICEEAELRRRLRPDGGGAQLLSGIFDEMCAALPNLSVFANERVLSVVKDGERIASVLARNTVTGRRTRFGGRIFVDATGDGWIGHFAGAKMMYGREAKAEYDEWPAPDVRDNLTMSGCLMACTCLGYEHRKAKGPRPFATPAWADVLPKGFTRKHVFNADSQWWTEHAGRFDDCADPEGARDQLVRINVAYWGWLKNSWANRATIANEELVSIAYRNGRREGMRIRGDYVLTANDCLQGRIFPDRVTYGGWPLDTHDPLGMENPTDDTWGYWKHHPDSPIYTIPFRCLYSVNVPNLMMAGRNISVTHIALGSTRVQATCLTLGQAAGTAAAEMVRKGLEPRAYGERHIAELQQLLLKDDQYIPQVKNEDPDDLVRRATVSATSYLRSEKIAIGHESLTVDVHAALPLDRPRATLFKRGDLRTLGAFRCNLRAFAGHSPSVTAIVYTASSPSGRAADRRQVGIAVARPVSHWQNWARFVPERPIRLEEPYAWVQLLPVENVTWSRCARRIGVGARMAESDGDWKVTENYAMAFCPEDGFRVPIDARAEKVADGVSRPVGDEWHGWVSDPRAGLPQTLSVSFDRPHDVAEVRLTFDSHLEKMHPSGMPMPPRLVRDYVLEGFDGNAWRKLDAVRDNDRRLRVHRFPAQTLAGFRVRVDATWGDASARIFEVRAYAAGRCALPKGWTDLSPSVDVKTSGVYRLTWKVPSAGGAGLVYVNGRRLNAERMTSPSVRGKTAFRRVESEPVALDPGDGVVASVRPEVSDVRVTTAHDESYWEWTHERHLDAETAFADLSGCRLEPGKLTIAVGQRLARPERAKVVAFVSDYWQNERARFEQEVTVDGTFRQTLDYPLDESDSHRAYVTVTFSGDRTVRRFLTCTTPCAAGYHRRLPLMAGWTCTWSNRLGVQRAAVNMPDDRRTDPQTREPIDERTYGLKLFVPPAFRGERYRFGFASAGIDNTLYVNGCEAPAFDSVLMLQPQSVDITDLLRPDATNELRLVCSSRRQREPQYAGNGDSWTRLLLDPWIESHPARAIAEVPRIRTSWRERTIEVRPQAVPDGCSLTHRVLRCGREVVPPFAEKVTWANPIAWGPGRDPDGIGSLEDFPLLELESTLRDTDGRVCDVRRTRFGFREFWTEGRHFLWNGKKYAGCGRAMIPRYGTAGRQTEQFVLDELERASRQANRFRRHGREMQFFYDFCDELGIVTSVSSAYRPTGQIPVVYRNNPSYWANKRKSDLALPGVYGHHPSVFTWYLSNEFWGYTPEGQKLLHPLIRALKEADPDHFVECGCDLDVGGATDTVSTHYPVHSLDDPATFVPDRHYWRPLDREFAVGCHVPFGQVKTVANTRGDSLITWGERPISAHETGWNHYLDYPNNPTRFWGDEAYNGAGNVSRMHWLYNRAYYVGHRDAGCYQIVDWMHPFSGSQPFVLPTADAVAVQRYHHFYAGERVRYDVNVFHDRLAREDVTFAWKVVADDGTVAAEGQRVFAADWCENFRAEIAFTAPAPGRYRLDYGSRPGPTRTIALTVSPREEPIGAAANLVTSDRPLDEALLERASRGETIVVLAREDYPAFLPVPLEVTRRVASVNFSFRRGHPVLAGIPEEDWSYWYPLHRTGAGYFNKPASGCAKTILEAGGPMGLAYSALVEVPVGKGCFLFTRLDLDVASQRRNPIARRLLANMLAYRVATAEPGLLGLLGFDMPSTLKLRKFGVSCEAYREGGSYAALYVNGSAHAPKDVPAFSGPVIVRNPSPAWGVVRSPLDERDRRGRAVKLPAADREPLLAGLTNYDLFLRQKSGVFTEQLNFTDPKLALAEVGTSRIRGGTPLAYPEVLVRGKGVLYETLNWTDPAPVVQRKLERQITTILANAGVRIEPARKISVPEGLYCWPVDLSAFLNRGLVDEKDDDGAGGCGDQGPEYDFRHWNPSPGVQDLGGVDWDIRLPNAMFVLSSRWRKPGNTYERVEIPLGGRTFDWLFLLHTSSWTMNFHNFSLFVDFADGRTHEIRFEGGVNMRGGESADPGAPFPEEYETETKPAVTFRQQRFGQETLYRTAWRNPNPAVPVKSVRFVTTGKSVPMIFALTLGDVVLDERKCDKPRCDRFAAEGAALLKAGRTQEAYTAYKAANRAHPGELYVYLELAECAKRTGDWKAALNWYERCLRVNGNQPPVWKLRDEAAERSGRK